MDERQNYLEMLKKFLWSCFVGSYKEEAGQ